MSETLNFEKTLQQLQRFLKDPVLNDRDRAGVIQAFEFTYEQSWKAVQKKSIKLGVSVASPKQAFVFCIQNNWIDSKEETKWIQMISDRNLTSHTYREDMAKEIFLRIQSEYLSMFAGLLANLQKN